MGLKHVQDDRIGFVVAVAVGDTPDDIRQVLFLCQQTRGLVARTAHGKAVNGDSLGLPAFFRIRMNADEKIGAVFLRNPHSFLEGDVVVPRSGQVGMVALAAV